MSGQAPDRWNVEVNRDSSAASTGCCPAEVAVTEATCSQNARIPPRRTRSANKRSASVGSCMNIKTNRPTAASNSRPESRDRASAWRNETLVICCAARRCSATPMASPLRSTPVTEPSGPTRALARKLTSPAPQPMSRTCMPARIPARRSIRSVSGLNISACSISRSYSARPRPKAYSASSMSSATSRVSLDHRLVRGPADVPFQGLAGDRNAKPQDQPDARGVGQQFRLRHRVAVDDQQVRELPLLHGADVLAESQRLRRGPRGGHQGLARGQPVKDHPLDLQRDRDLHVTVQRD